MYVEQRNEKGSFYYLLAVTFLSYSGYYLLTFAMLLKYLKMQFSRIFRPTDNILIINAAVNSERFLTENGLLNLY